MEGVELDEGHDRFAEGDVDEGGEGEAEVGYDGGEGEGLDGYGGVEGGLVAVVFPDCEAIGEFQVN